MLGELNNQYAFKVARDATKPEIKKPLRQYSMLSLLILQVLNVKGKTKRSGKGKFASRLTGKRRMSDLKRVMKLTLLTWLKGEEHASSKV